ncbi:MAG: CvpA family protein [Spirochaetia bacterium]|nr:CvpA family protein [Spirochaetia bacterium]
MNVSPIDIIALVIIIPWAIWGAYKGFLSESATLAGLALGIFVAVTFTGPAVQVLKSPIQRFNLGIWGTLIVFIILMIAGFVISKLFLSRAEKSLELVHLTYLDNLLGCLFGIIKGLAVTTFIIFVIRFQNMFEISEVLAGSTVVEIVSPVLLYLLKFSGKEYLRQITGGLIE